MTITATIDLIRPHASGLFLVRFLVAGVRYTALISPTAPGADDLRSGAPALLTVAQGRITRAAPVGKAA